MQQKPVKFQPTCFKISAFPEPLQCNGGHISPTHKAENHNQLLEPQQSLLADRLQPELDYITSSPDISSGKEKYLVSFKSVFFFHFIFQALKVKMNVFVIYGIYPTCQSSTHFKMILLPSLLYILSPCLICIWPTFTMLPLLYLQLIGLPPLCWSSTRTVVGGLFWSGRAFFYTNRQNNHRTAGYFLHGADLCGARQDRPGKKKEIFLRVAIKKQQKGQFCLPSWTMKHL